MTTPNIPAHIIAAIADADRERGRLAAFVESGEGIEWRAPAEPSSNTATVILGPDDDNVVRLVPRGSIAFDV